MSSFASGSAALPHRWHGRGEPLVLLPGLGGKGTSWQPFLATASQRFQTLTLELPGSRNGPRLASPVTIAELALRVLELLEQLGLQRVRVVGRSMGGMIAQELALLDPSRVERLVLASTTARVDRHLSEVFLLWARMAETGVPAEIRHQSSLLWCLGSHSLADQRRVQLYLTSKGAADNPRDYALQARACAAHDALDRLRQLDMPVLVVTGSDDRLTPAPHAETLAKAIPRAEVITIPGAGHLPYLETPDRFAEVVMRFLSPTEATEGMSSCPTASRCS
jgi:pimeloyl-ACP methyl ester carboxylesterase